MCKFSIGLPSSKADTAEGGVIMLVCSWCYGNIFEALGSMGRVNHYRCKMCGMSASYPWEEEDTEEEDTEEERR